MTYDSDGNIIFISDSNLQPTGYYAVKNIYDMAGNVSEWTMEASGTTSRVTRGGWFGSVGAGYSAYDRLGYSLTATLGFRAALYLK